MACPILLEDLDQPLNAAAQESSATQVPTSTPTVNQVNWHQLPGGWTKVKAVPDSGAQISVTDEQMAPGFAIRANEASKAGRGFISASKGKIPCIGELDLPTQSSEGHWTRQKWNVAPAGTLAKPLLSIGSECDGDNLVIFGKKGGMIINQVTKCMRRFPRLSNGTYEIEMYLPPAQMVEHVSPGFTR